MTPNKEPLPPELWLKRSNVIGAEVCSKAGLEALVKARTYNFDGYSRYISESLLQETVAEAEARGREHLLILMDADARGWNDELRPMLLAFLQRYRKEK